MISNVTGFFNVFSVDVAPETNDFSGVKLLMLRANVDSRNTNNAQRDKYLKSEDFFDAASNPRIAFTEKEFALDENGAILSRELTEALICRHRIWRYRKKSPGSNISGLHCGRQNQSKGIPVNLR
jgi:hypothetical protein